MFAHPSAPWDCFFLTGPSVLVLWLTLPFKLSSVSMVWPGMPGCWLLGIRMGEGWVIGGGCGGGLWGCITGGGGAGGRCDGGAACESRSLWYCIPPISWLSLCPLSFSPLSLSLFGALCLGMRPSDCCCCCWAGCCCTLSVTRRLSICDVQPSSGRIALLFLDPIDPELLTMAAVCAELLVLGTGVLCRALEDFGCACWRRFWVLYAT